MKKTLLLSAFALALLPIGLAEGERRSLVTAPSLPTPREKEIVVPTTIAGLKPGMKLAAARNSWGATRGTCNDNPTGAFVTCQYGAQSGPTGSATYGTGPTDKLGGISIYGGYVDDNTTFPYTGPIAASLKGMKTEEGIGLGSPIAQVAAAYPKAKKIGGGKTPHISYEIAGKTTTMTFSAATKTKKIGQIRINVIER
jgi:hypothetical protein